MTWTLALLITAMVAFYALGYLTACVVNAPLLRGVPEHPLLQVAESLREPGEVLVGVSRLHLVPPPPVPPPPVPYDWEQDAEALGWLEGA